MLPELVELVLQFDDRLLEIELMFHASGDVKGSAERQATRN